MTDHLHALAMRTAATEVSVPYAIGRRYMPPDFQRAILALPLEADHAALVREAVKLPEIAALIEAAKRASRWKNSGDVVIKLVSALKALETP